MPNETIAGRKFAWTLIKKLGEGDAGEVYLVESLLDKQNAILKRPVHNAFTSDILRQSAQIEREGKVLSALATLDLSESPVKVPILLDQSKNGTELSERFFIVTTRAGGVDLGSLARIIHAGAPNQWPNDNSPAAEANPDVLSPFIRGLIDINKFPEMGLIRTIRVMIDFLERIHSFEIHLPGLEYSGVIWNDLKPDHVFWDPVTTSFTLIDWGNANFLEADGGTADRQNSRLDDFSQFIHTFGDFVASVSPDLFGRLNWPKNAPIQNIYTEAIQNIKSEVSILLADGIQELKQLRQNESDICLSSTADMDGFQRLLAVHKRIIGSGEVPNYSKSEEYAWKVADALIEQMRLEELRTLCSQNSDIEAFHRLNWQLLETIAKHASNDSTSRLALKAGRTGNWSEAIWQLRLIANVESGSHWWEKLVTKIRQDLVGASSEILTPFTALNRLQHALLSITMHPASNEIDSSTPPEVFERLIRLLKEMIIPHWKAVEPDPPDSGVEYREIERLLPEFISVIPSAGRALEYALDQPRAQAGIVIDAWERQDFELSRQALRRLLLWDPDRMRIFTADRAIQAAPQWLEAIRRGPKRNEPLQEYVTRLELQGRDLRNQVGSASWLDETLSMLSRLRSNGEPSEVLTAFPQARDLIGWIFELETERPAMSLSSGPVLLERLPMPQLKESSVRGVKEVSLGPDFQIMGSLDTWTPEAKGSSARVFLGVIRLQKAREVQTALKIMRPDQAEYALPLFREEVQVLTMLSDVPGVAPLFEYGFIKLDNPSELPPEDRPGLATDLKGRVRRFGKNALHQFLMELNSPSDPGWIPYLATALQDRSENLLMVCDSSYTRGRFLPILEGLRIAVQICDILQAAHSRNIVYRDHKILHYYWKQKENGVMMIDWNIARRYPEGLTKSDTQFDLVQFCARALHHILTGRSAPGSLPLGPTRSEEIEAAARSYTVHWTYDDQRLPKEVKEILANGMQGEFLEAKQLRDSLFQEFQLLHELVPKSNSA